MNTPQNAPQNAPLLLAVDLGARCQVALFGADGRLMWCHAFDVASEAQLRRHARELIGGQGRPPGPLSWLITRGDVAQAAVWERVAMRQGVRVQRVSSQSVREQCWGLVGDAPSPSPRSAALGLARQVARWSGDRAGRLPAARATRAILVGLCGAVDLGCLRGPPRRRLAAVAP